MSQLILFNKPFGVICQFSAHEKHQSLAEYISIKDVYAAGRLDHDSEGLLLLTDNGKLQHKISDPKNKMQKTYWVQVDKEITADAIEQLTKGVLLKDGKTRPAQARIISQPQGLWERNPPVRFRKNIPTSWLELTISEGRNRQVRRMTAAVGFPTLRLVRCQIGEWRLGDLQPGELKEIDI
jgi:23S rRNA pseudouridine2457 synthase